MDSAALQTRYRLKVLEFHFETKETTSSIQSKLQNIYANKKTQNSETSFNQFYLVAQPAADALFYNITDYILRCLAGDQSVAERLRDRTLLYIYQSDEKVDDLLSESGVNAFINRILTGYVSTYGIDAISGFAFELPRFLSVFESDGISVPWSGTLLDRIQEEHIKDGNRGDLTNERGSFLPFLFYDRYNSPVIRSVFWQELTSQFAQCFLGKLRDFCDQHKVKLAVTIPASARLLQYDLGTLLDKVDFPILIVSESETQRHFVVAKSVCSNAQYAGIFRKETITFSQCLSDATLGFNQWISNNINEDSSASNTHESMTDLLQVGYPKRSILMLSPTQSLWMRPEEKQWNSITKSWGWLCQTVWNLGYDYDVVSEAQFFDASINKKKGVINLNEKEYTMVILPSCLSLHESSVNRLTEFVQAKGRLIVNGPVPYLLNGRVGVEPYILERLIYRQRTAILDGPQGERMEDLKKLLRKWIVPSILLYTGQENHLLEDVQVHHRMNRNDHIFYLFNTEEKQIETLVEITGEVELVEVCHLQTGKRVPLTFWHANGKTYLNYTFDSQQGLLLVVS